MVFSFAGVVFRCAGYQPATPPGAAAPLSVRVDPLAVALHLRGRQVSFSKGELAGFTDTAFPRSFRETRGARVTRLDPSAAHGIHSRVRAQQSYASPPRSLKPGSWQRAWEAPLPSPARHQPGTAASPAAPGETAGLGCAPRRPAKVCAPAGLQVRKARGGEGRRPSRVGAEVPISHSGRPACARPARADRGSLPSPGSPQSRGALSERLFWPSGAGVSGQEPRVSAPASRLSRAPSAAGRGRTP